jgi:hypothetical protein
MTKTFNYKTTKKAEGRGADLSNGASLGDVPRLGADEEDIIMAASYLPEPGKVVRGTEIGPCVSACDHKDCMLTRQQSRACCAICGEEIGYETAFYTAPRDDIKKWYGNEISPFGTMVQFMTDGTRDKQLVHAVCYEKKIRLERESI